MTERHFRVVQLDGKKIEIGGVSISSKASPGNAARKLLTSIAHHKGLKKNKKASMHKVKFCIQEYTQGSSKKVYGPYVGHYHKYTAAELKKAMTADGKVKFTMKPVVKLVKGMKGGVYGLGNVRGWAGEKMGYSKDAFKPTNMRMMSTVSQGYQGAKNMASQAYAAGPNISGRMSQGYQGAKNMASQAYAAAFNETVQSKFQDKQIFNGIPKKFLFYNKQPVISSQMQATLNKPLPVYNRSTTSLLKMTPQQQMISQQPMTPQQPVFLGGFNDAPQPMNLMSFLNLMNLNYSLEEKYKNVYNVYNKVFDIYNTLKKQQQELFTFIFVGYITDSVYNPALNATRYPGQRDISNHPIILKEDGTFSRLDNYVSSKVVNFQSYTNAHGLGVLPDYNNFISKPDPNDPVKIPNLLPFRDKTVFNMGNPMGYGGKKNKIKKQTKKPVTKTKTKKDSKKSKPKSKK